ncbi:RNA-directed DNA polymerase, eukaryota, reverse transcriptase zinc-binding domain protein [Tanacetum coccineum]
MEEAYKGSGNLVDRMRNIDGKMVREGKICKEMRGAALSQSDTFNLSQDGEVREISSALTQNLDSNHSGPSGTSSSYASLLKNPNTATTQKAVRLQNTSNPEKVQGLHFRWWKTMSRMHGRRMEKVLETGPWMIQRVPIFLNIWTPNSKLTKDTISATPIWVKMHNVPMVAYCEEGLSLIMSQIGNPIMFDAYTSRTYKKSWGKNDYARALIEISSMSPMMQEVIMAIPFTNGTGQSLEKVEVEYEWVPPRCKVCKIFDHIDDECPKKPKVKATTHVEDDGFTKVTKRNGKKKQNTVKQVAGIRFSKPKVYIMYWEVSKTTNSGDKIIDPGDKGAIPNEPNIVKPSLKEVVTPSVTVCSNSFGALDSNDDVVDNIENKNWKPDDCVNESDSDVDELIMENENGTRHDSKRVKLCSSVFKHWDWTSNGADGILKKIDHVLGNSELNDSFKGALAIFQPYRTSDHSPAVLKLPCHVKAKPKPFKFYNIITQHDRFKEVVKNGWEVHVSGFLMYNVVKKFRNLKKPFRKLLYENGNIHKNVDVLRVELDRVQTDLDQDPNNISLRDEEAAYVIEYSDALLLQERFLRQKAKIQWLKEGDSNSAFFHKTVKSKVNKSRINVVANSDGQPGITQDLNIDDLFGTKLDENDALNMIRNVSSSEAKEAIFSMGNDKSPVVKEFFTNGRLLKELNHTIIALVPKKQHPSRVNDYRPISCCRSIADNILLTQELMHNYHLDCGVPRYDLFLFAHGDPDSASAIMEELDEFKLASGLIPSLPKSTTYFFNVLNHIKIAILQILQFEEGSLPVKYLGVPLITSRLVYRDCKELIEKVESRINDWKNKSLSNAGRLQLVQSVISSMHVYWSSMFILPTCVLLDIEQLMRGFLWKGRSKVAWEVVCLPKVEGGLGIKRLGVFNNALILSPLASFISSRDIYQAGLTSNSKVSDLLLEGTLVWPPDLIARYPALLSVTSPSLVGPRDQQEWRNRSGNIVPFSVNEV